MFTIGQQVNRIEDREITGATVTAIDGENVELAYDEGGSGWWPIECLEAIPDPD